MPLLKFNGDQLYPAVEEAGHEVTLEEWQANPQAHAGASALVIPNDVAIDDLGIDVSDFNAIILQFPAFKDGRAYSQARLLRERFDYRGELRARGEVLRDQLLFMRRCGFDAFELAGSSIEGAGEAFDELSFAYQPGADGAVPVWHQRLHQTKAA